MLARRGLAATAAAICLAAALATAGGRPGAAMADVRLAGAAIPPDPGAVPDRALDLTIHTEQLQLVTAAAAAELATADLAVTLASSQVHGDEVALAADRAGASAASQELASASAAAVTTAADLGAARRTVAAERAAVSEDVAQIREMAVAWYIDGGGQPSTAAPETLSQSEALAGAGEQLVVVTDSIEAADRQDLQSEAGAARAAAADQSRLARERALQRTAAATHAERSATLAAAASALATAQGTLQEAVTVASAARQHQAGAAAAFDGPEGGGPSPAPTILGRPALSAAQLTGWYEAAGYADLTATPIRKLAGWYIAEGDAEGVRGDIAFAQAIVETGGFASPDAVDENNYAGIGHCDTCSHGLRFPSARAGVRGQIQLLRTFAQAGLTAADLANPPVLAALDPADQSARGCCRTWSSLTGHWATDPDYGLTVLDLYQSMLSWAVGNPPS